MKNFKKTLFRILGFINIPEEINTEHDLLIHISDTPNIVFSDIKHLIKTLKPKYIVHTGDFVDNIKLELYPHRLEDHKTQLTKLINILEESSARRIFMCVGNHDDEEALSELTTRVEIVSTYKKTTLENLDFTMVHNSHEIDDYLSTYNLYGHDLEKPSCFKNNMYFLNGIDNIHVIDLTDKKIYYIRYPLGTTDSRLNKNKLGI
jgi:predicted MPP superfamily phosphohydrolase